MAHNFRSEDEVLVTLNVIGSKGDVLELNGIVVNANENAVSVYVEINSNDHIFSINPESLSMVRRSFHPDDVVIVVQDRSSAQIGIIQQRLESGVFLVKLSTGEGADAYKIVTMESLSHFDPVPTREDRHTRLDALLHEDEKGGFPASSGPIVPRLEQPTKPPLLLDIPLDDEPSIATMVEPVQPKEEPQPARESDKADVMELSRMAVVPNPDNYTEYGEEEEGEGELDNAPLMSPEASRATAASLSEVMISVASRYESKD